MKFFWLNFISFIIAVSALFTSYRFEIISSNDGADALSSLPLLKLDPMKSPNEKGPHRGDILDYNSVGHSVLNSLSELTVVSFLHYLPIHSLYRLKDFFLLL
jgi:hypothetical protein